MLHSSSLILFGLMVGIGGGAPSEKHDIRLGDVVVSSPVGRIGGVIHHEFRKTIQDKKLKRTGSVDAPPPLLLAAWSKVSSLHERKGHGIAQSIRKMVTQNPRWRQKCQQPDCESDRLYKATFVHADSSQECRMVCGAQAGQVVERRQHNPDQDDPVIPYGLIATADRVMNDAMVRNIFAKEEEVLCFEMEAGGADGPLPVCGYTRNL
jgi:nucleoside phosphorylase